jgi:hypothetical protein
MPVVGFLRQANRPIEDGVFTTLGLQDFQHADNFALENKAGGSRGVFA